MAENRWISNSQYIAQQDTITASGSVTGGGGDVVNVTINGKSVTYTTISTDTLASTMVALQALLAATTITEFLDASWTYPGSGVVVNVAAVSPGIPYTFTVSHTGAVVLTAANVTVSAGPSDPTIAANWSLGHTPTSTDAIVFDGNDGGLPVLWNLGSFTVASVDYRANFTQQNGLPRRNASNGGYYEYRTRFLTWNTSTGTIGTGSGPGCGQMYIEIVASSTWTIYTTGPAQVTNAPTVDIISAGNPTALNILGGSVGLCITDESTTPTVATVTVNSSLATFAQGNGTTVTAINNYGGTATSRGTDTTLTQNGGSYIQQLGTLTNIVATGGYIGLEQSGTITSVVCKSQGPGPNAVELDCSQNSLARIFTNGTLTGGTAWLDPNKTVTLTNPIAMDAASVAVSEIGVTFNLQRT